MKNRGSRRRTLAGRGIGGGKCGIYRSPTERHSRSANDFNIAAARYTVVLKGKALVKPSVMLDNPDGDDAMIAASSGRGHRCVGATALIAFSNALNARGAWVDIVETFEITEGAEIARTDLSIYGHHGAYDLPAVQRQALAAHRLAEMMTAAATEPAKLGFYVWFDQAG